jgi:hypothetical protein
VTKKSAVGGTIVITAVLALWWLLDPHGPRHTTHTRSASLEVPARGGQPDATLSRGQEPTPGRSVATGTLQLWVETETTLPPNGVVRWVSTRDRPLWPPSLDSPHTEQDGVGTPVEQQELADGRARIAIPSSSWIWLSIRSSAGTAYRLVAPFTGNKELRVRIHPGRCGLHAWFVTADGAQPESNSSVRVMRRNPGTGRTEELLAEQLSQHPGYAHFENLIPSFFVVLSPGATIEDLPPQVGGSLRAARPSRSRPGLHDGHATSSATCRSRNPRRLRPAAGLAPSALLPLGGCGRVGLPSARSLAAGGLRQLCRTTVREASCHRSSLSESYESSLRAR